MSSTTAHPLYPFLTRRPNSTDTYVYRATQEGDLRLFLEAVRADLTLLSTIKQVYLVEKYDNIYDSGILDFVDAYNAVPATASVEEDDYETEDQGKEDTVCFIR